MAVRLDRLLNEVDVFERPADARKIEIHKLTESVQAVEPGTLFFCVPGSTHDGHDFAPQAVEQGAVALVVERELPLDIPQVHVPDVRASMAPIASSFFDHPDRRLRIVGITGTNGKTTTADLLATILRAHRWSTATIGTLSGAYTSPPAIELHRILSEMVAEHNNAVVMEVSSHALVQHRVDAIRFSVGVFTNLTQDHLDYHKTMSRYFEAKSRLFEPGRIDNAVINSDDKYGQELMDRVAVPMTTYSINDAENLQIGAKGSTFTWQGQEINLKLVGKFNVYNALAAATAARAMNVMPSVIAQALTDARPVPGRMEQVDRGQPFTVVVDFAHTPDGIENVLTTARSLTESSGGKVAVVFGCGGERDHAKRPLMGKAAQNLADVVVVTTDNSRSEDPQSIADEILGGMQPSDDVHVLLDRRQAIFEAIAHAREGDVVVIAGKGHETTQHIGADKMPFDDRIVAAQAIDHSLGRGPTA